MCAVKSRGVKVVYTKASKPSCHSLPQQLLGTASLTGSYSLAAILDYTMLAIIAREVLVTNLCCCPPSSDIEKAIIWQSTSNMIIWKHLTTWLTCFELKQTNKQKTNKKQTNKKPNMVKCSWFGGAYVTLPLQVISITSTDTNYQVSTHIYSRFIDF